MYERETALFKALSDENRLRIIAMLASELPDLSRAWHAAAMRAGSAIGRICCPLFLAYSNPGLMTRGRGRCIMAAYGREVK